MSEQGRTTLKPFGKSDRKLSKSAGKTFRFNFRLSNPNEDSCPVFDYAIQLKSKERKILKKQREERQKKINGLAELGKDEDDEDVRRIARKFEEKYGDKKGKNKSYTELGAGYDETDPFIDNTEVRDEELQEDVVTPHGGYYINCGPLELKRVQVSDQSDADDIGKYKQKKTLPVIEEEEEEKTEDRKVEQLNGDAKLASDEEPCDFKDVQVSEDKNSEEKSYVPCNGDNSEDQVKQAKKRSIPVDIEVGALKPKKQKTVRTLLEEKRIEETLSAEESNKQPASVTSISEAIESVINAGNNDENSNGSSASHPDSESASSASRDSEDSKPSVSPPPLPQNLSPELLNLVEQVKHFAQVTENTRKTFHPSIDSCLMKIEWKCTDFSTTNRHLLFGHLASYLPCTKDTLMRKAKKLFIIRKEKQVETLICKLKATIDATMPTLLENYGKACQRIAEEKSFSVPSLNGSSAGESHQTPDSATAKLPKRKFPWTDETRGYLRDIVKLKNRCYKILKPRKYSNADYINAFLQSKIWILWPQGWMKLSILLRESSRSPVSGKSKPKHSSSHSRQRDSSRLSNLESYPPVPCDSTLEPEPLHVSTADDVPHHLKSPLARSTPTSSKSPGDHTNLLTKVTSPAERPPSPVSETPNHSHSSKTKQEASVDYLSKRTNDRSNCNDFNTTLSDLLKLDSVVMNGASLPLENVNNSQKNHSIKTEKVINSCSLNSSSCNGTPGVIQSVATNERTMMRASDSVSLSVNAPSDGNLNNSAYLSSSNRKEVCSNLPLNRKQRLLQVNTQSNWQSLSSCAVEVKKETDYEIELPYSSYKPQSLVVDGTGRRMSDETTTATDILSQIISESLLAPSQPPSTTPIPSLFNTKIKDQSVSFASKNNQELLFDVMQDLKELNDLSSRGPPENKLDNKSNNCYQSSWTHSSQLSQNLSRSCHSPFQNEFMKHLHNTQLEAATPSTPTSTSPYSNHSISPFENSTYINEINHHSPFNSSPHRTVQNMSHVGTPAGKVPNMNQTCTAKPLPNAGHPHGFMSQMDFNADNQHQHLLGMSQNFQYGLNNWHYTGSESQSHQ